MQCLQRLFSFSVGCVLPTWPLCMTSNVLKTVLLLDYIGQLRIQKLTMHKKNLQVDHLNNIHGVTFMDAKERKEGDYELIEEIDGTQWQKGDRIVLLSGAYSTLHFLISFIQYQCRMATTLFRCPR